MGVGLALSGGALRGFAHIGVLKFIEEQNIKVDAIAGTSAGSIIGAYYAAGISPGEMEDLALNLTRSDFFRNIPRTRLPRRGLINTEFIARILERDLGRPDFSDLYITLDVVAVDIIENCLVCMNQGDVISAVTASCAIPGIFSPVKRNGRTLVDGGVLQSVPTSILQQKKVRPIIAVDLTQHSPLQKEPRNIIEMFYKSTYLMTRDREEKNARQADYWITPDLGDIGSWDLKKTKEAIELGYQAAREDLQDFKMKKSPWEKILSFFSNH